MKGRYLGRGAPRPYRGGWALAALASPKLGKLMGGKAVIDELVGALYGLTPDEIKIVEGAAK